MNTHPTEFQSRLVVGKAELAVSDNTQATLVTYSLGSCLGVVVYDPIAKVGGLLHAMLPDSTIAPRKAAAHPGMFVDTGVPNLFQAVCQLGAQKHRMSIAVAGGAQALESTGDFSIGRRNVEALSRLFAAQGLRVVAEQVGGLVNRTIYLSLATGELRLKISGQPKELILLCKYSMTT